MTFYRIARCLLLCCSLTRVKPDHVLTMKTVKTAKTNKPGDRRDERTQPNRAQQIEFQPIPAPHRYVILFKGNLFRVVPVEQPESAAESSRSRRRRRSRSRRRLADKAIAVSMHLNLHTLAFNLIHCLSRALRAVKCLPNRSCCCFHSESRSILSTMDR